MEKQKQKPCLVFLLIKHSVKEFMTIAKKRRMGKKKSKLYTPLSNKEEAGECFLHVYSINTHVLLTIETKIKSPFQVHRGFKSKLTTTDEARKYHVSRAQNTR